MKAALDNLEDPGSLPNHKYIVTKNTGQKVWEKDPKIVIGEIAKLYNQTQK